MFDDEVEDPRTRENWMTTNARLRRARGTRRYWIGTRHEHRLVVSESAISAAVSGLSAEVGVALIDRHGRGVRLTPAGQRYVEYARRILGLHGEALLAARGEADPGKRVHRDWPP